MDLSYLDSWLQQTQNATILSALNNERPGQALSSPPVWQESAPPAWSAAQLSADEPLDLRVMPVEATSSSTPLDLTVRPSSKGLKLENVCKADVSNCNTSAPSYATSPVVYSQPTAFPPTSQQHALMFSNDRRRHCVNCGFQCDFNLKDEFEHHISKHRRHPQNFFCIHCQLPFSDHNSLREHLLVHHILYHNICLTCGVAFRTPHLYAAHVSEVHNGLNASLLYSGVPSQMATENAPHRRGSLLASPPNIACSTPTPLSTRTCSSPQSMNSNSLSSPLSNATRSSLQPTFGQSLAKQIEAAISQQVAGGKTPSVSDLMFMKIDDANKVQEPYSTNNSVRSNPLNLMNLLEDVVERSIRDGAPVQKKDLEFTVTFSDGEDGVEDEVDCASAVVAEAGQTPSRARQDSTTSNGQNFTLAERTDTLSNDDLVAKK